jgi:hypothetical protein
LTYPANGAVDVDQGQAATWTAVPNAEAYYLQIGSSAGGRDLLSSGDTHLTSSPLVGLPAGQTLYARVSAKVNGIWRHRDSTFSAAPYAPEFIHPTDGATGVNPSLAFEWTVAAGADAHRLIVGSAPGTSDFFDSGDIAQPSVSVVGLPATGPIYARVVSRIGATGDLRRSDIVFTLDAPGPGPTVIRPTDGTTTFDTQQPFEWVPVPLARAYRLTIGSTPGGADIHDSGPIHVTRRFVRDLPIGVALFGRVHTEIDGGWYTTDFGFSVAANTASAATEIKNALWATDLVRTMASLDGRPYSWTPLFTEVAPSYAAVGTHYTAVLLQVLSEMNLQAAARRLDVAFNPNTYYDQHALVELMDVTTGRWIVLDPTFDLAARNLDGTFATAEDIAQATGNFNWGAIVYVLLGSAGDAYVTQHSVDYPLLYRNVYHAGQPVLPGQGNSPLPYLVPVSLPLTGGSGVYAVRCDGSPIVNVVLDGNAVQMECNGIDSLSPAFPATSVSDPGGPSPFILYELQRYVFP